MVSRCEGSVEAVAEAAALVAFAVLDGDETGGVEVTVRLTTTGMSVTVGMSAVPLCRVVEIVANTVVLVT